MKKIRFSIVLTLFFVISANAQDINYAIDVVRKLASDEFHGRGYVSNGDKIAAKFIRSEFQKLGLTPINEDYFQTFSTSVNTFPSDMSLSVNGKILSPGIDYLIDPGSPSIKGDFSTIIISADDIINVQILRKKLRASIGKIIVIQDYTKNDYTKNQQKTISDAIRFLKFSPKNPAAGTIILTNEKLTWHISSKVNSKPSFTISTKQIETPIQNVKISVENRFFEDYQTQNVIGKIEGTNKDSLVVLIAHYDHIGEMGSEAIFRGANDNASGVAMLLNLAKHYSTNKPNYTTAFIALGAEELGLIGAKYFVDNPLFDLSKIKFLLNFDMAGTGDDGIQVVNGSIFKDQFDTLVKLNDKHKLLKQVKIRGEACNSDHCMFYKKGVPCFFIYTLGGIRAYHDIYDRAETLPLTEFEDYFKLITLFIKEL